MTIGPCIFPATFSTASSDNEKTRVFCRHIKFFIVSGSSYHGRPASPLQRWSPFGPGRYSSYAVLTPELEWWACSKADARFQGEDNSPASFEKTLSALSTKITQASTRLDATRQQARRFTALWTLYSIFIYLLYTTIDVLVLGWKNWGVLEYAAVFGGPLV